MNIFKSVFLFGAVSLLSGCIEYDLSGFISKDFIKEDGFFVHSQISIENAKLELPQIEYSSELLESQGVYLKIHSKSHFYTLRLHTIGKFEEEAFHQAESVTEFPSGRLMDVREDIVEYRSLELTEDLTLYLAYGEAGQLVMVGAGIAFLEAPSGVSLRELDTHQQEFEHRLEKWGKEAETTGVFGTYGNAQTTGLYFFYDVTEDNL